MVNSGHYPYMQFNKMALRVYTVEEIKSLSVVQVDQVNTFDEVSPLIIQPGLMRDLAAF